MLTSLMLIIKGIATDDMNLAAKIFESAHIICPHSGYLFILFLFISFLMS
jgi:hypothetical protein